MEQLTIMYYGLEFTVWGYYTPSIGYPYELEKAQFDVKEIYSGNENIIEVLKDYVVEDLNNKALESILNR